MSSFTIREPPSRGSWGAIYGFMVASYLLLFVRMPLPVSTLREG